MPDYTDEIKTDTRDFQWYKRDARAYYEGTRRLTLEARGAYADIIDLIYIHGGALPDDPKWMSHALFVSVRKWKALREELISSFKIECEDGEITNSRATLEIEKRATRSRVNRENSVKQSRKVAENSKKPNEINKTDPISLGDTRATLELEIEEEERTPIVPQGGSWDNLQPDQFLADGVFQAQDGSIHLTDKLREFWIEKFGDSDRLDLALIEAAGERQPGSRQPLRKQVERSLARIAGRKREGDSRYRETVQRNQSATKSGKTRVSRDAFDAALEQLGTH